MQPHSCGEPYGDTYPPSFKEPQLTSLCWNLKNEGDKIQSESCTEKKFYTGELCDGGFTLVKDRIESWAK